MAEEACWRPYEFADVDISTRKVPSFVELRRAHAELSEEHKRLESLYKVFDTEYYDYDKEGEGHHRYHPASLPRRHQLLPVSAMGSENEFNKGAQRRYSQIVHNAAWLKLQA